MAKKLERDYTVSRIESVREAKAAYAASYRTMTPETLDAGLAEYDERLEALYAYLDALPLA